MRGKSADRQRVQLLGRTVVPILLSSLTTMLAVAAVPVMPAAAPSPSSAASSWQRLAAHVGARHGGFVLVSAARAQLEDIDDVVDFGVAVRRDGGDVLKVLLLGSTGEELTALALQERQFAARNETYGKLTPRLFERLRGAGANADADAGGLVRVTIWPQRILADPERPTFFASSGEALAYRLSVRARRAAALAEGRVELLSALDAVGATEVRPLAGPPVVVATLPRREVEALAGRADVAAVDLAITEDEPTELFAARHFYDADDDEVLEQYSDLGRHGTGIRVGVYEWSNYCGLWRENAATPAGFSTWSGYDAADPVPGIYGCQDPGVADGDPCNTLCNNGEGFCRGGYCRKEHVTMVASKLGCIRDGERRNASAMHLYYGNVGDRAQRLSWLADQGVTVVNDSEGSGNDPNLNWSIRNDFITIAKSAGNSQAAPIDCPDNTICTGSYSIAAVENIDWWKVDPGNEAGRYGLSGSTSFIDSSSRWDADKPDVMGDGEATLVSPMVSPHRSEWVNAYGTSFAAPMVGGIVALLEEEYPTAQNWPELVRPMILAAALRHDVIGVSLSRNGPPDEIDGAGVPTATTLREIIANGSRLPFTLVPGTFDGAGHYFPPGASVTLAPGSTVRAVLGWMYCVEAGASKLAADFDLILVERGTGSTVDWSTSFTNSLEMVQFTNRDDQPKTFDLRIDNAGFASCNGVQREYAGLAWAVTVEDVGPSRLLAVTKTGDGMDFVCDTDCSLREAVRAANAYPGLDRITVPAGTYPLSIGGASEDGSLAGDLDVLDDLELVGDGTGDVTISGETLDRVFDVREGSRLRLSRVTLEDGRVSGEPGGAIAVRGGSLELEDCSVLDSSAEHGGGIWSDGGAVTLRRSRIAGNVAGTYGGGLYIEGGAVSVMDSSIDGNRANHSGGGLFNAAGFTRLQRSTISFNEALEGGGIRNADDLQLDNCTVSGNHADLEGGGIWNGNGATAALNETTFRGNTAPSGTVLWTQGIFGFRRSLIDGDCVRFGLLPAYDEHDLESPGSTCGLRAGWNITGIADLMLGDLYPYGGPTRTHAPRPRSPALDPSFSFNPIPGTCPPDDQRGAGRPQDADGDGTTRCDAGSVERTVSELRFANHDELRWLEIPGATRYNVYRGRLIDLLSTGHAGAPSYGRCVNGLDPNLLDTRFVDPAGPHYGDGFFYLRSATTPAGETPLGWDSGGGTRWPPAQCP